MNSSGDRKEDRAIKNNANDLTFPNVKAVSDYLSETGWKIGKTQVYEHAKSRKVRPRADGLFYERDVKNYAQRFLKRIDAANTRNPNLEKVQERRLQAEATKMEAQAEHWRIKARSEAGIYVPRDAFERALAQRAALFRGDLENFCYSEVGNFINLCRGDPQCSPEMIQFMLDRFSVFLDRYSEPERAWETSISPTEGPGNNGSPGEDEDDDEEGSEDFYGLPQEGPEESTS